MSYNNDENDLAPTHEQVHGTLNITPSPESAPTKRSTPVEKKTSFNTIVEALQELDTDSQVSVLRAVVLFLDLKEDF